MDGTSYIDYIGSWGPLILGHAHPAVVAAIQRQARARHRVRRADARSRSSWRSGSPRAVPSIEMVRMVNSGTEATMAALRLARAATGRPRIIKFEGCYHGHADAFLVKAGSGAATFGVPDSPGVTAATARDTLTARFNDSRRPCARSSRRTPARSPR